MQVARVPGLHINLELNFVCWIYPWISHFPAEFETSLKVSVVLIILPESDQKTPIQSPKIFRTTPVLIQFSYYSIFTGTSELFIRLHTTCFRNCLIVGWVLYKRVPTCLNQLRNLPVKLKTCPWGTDIPESQEESTSSDLEQDAKITFHPSLVPLHIQCIKSFQACSCPILKTQEWIVQ